MAQDRTFYFTPWIQEIKLPTQYADIPNQSFYLDDLGHLFLGKENGLTIVNGDRSLHLHMNGPVYVTGDGSDTLYYASENDMGYLFMDDQRGFRTKSLANRIQPHHRSFRPKDLICMQGQVFMNTSRGIFTLRHGRIHHFPFEEGVTQLHQLQNSLYLTVSGRGLLRWAGNEFQELISERDIGDRPILFLRNENDTLQILTTTGALYTFGHEDDHPRLRTRFEDVDQVTFLERMGPDHILVASLNSGLSILDHRGNLVNNLGSKKGLPERGILQVITCEDHESWILAPHSLHKVTYPSPIQILETNASESGRILASSVYENKIILASSNGVYQADQVQSSVEGWELTSLFPSSHTSFHLLSSARNLIFAAGSENLVAIRDGLTEVLDMGTFSGMIALNDRALIASSETGIHLYRNSEKGWNKSSLDTELSASHSFVNLKNEFFCICGNGVYRISKDLRKVMPIPFHMEELLFKLIPMYGELYLVGVNRVYRYEKSENTFLPLPWDLTAEILASADVIVSDEADGYWIAQHVGSSQSRLFKTGGMVSEGAFQRSFPILQNLGEIIDLSIRDSLLYITGKDKITLFNLSLLSLFEGEVPLRIEKFTSNHTGELNLDFPSSSSWFSEEGKIILSRGTHDFDISLAGLEYQSVPEPLFRHMILPLQEKWTEWSPDRTLSFTNLKHGDYTLITQAKDLYGRISESSELSITIKPPHYRTWYALVIYAILLLLGYFLFQKWRHLSYQLVESRVSQRMQTKLDILKVEKEKSDKLVAEILPERTAAQIKSKGKAKWEKYERATVLFSDIQGFTRIAEEMNPELLIDELDKFFFHFDSVVEKYNIEKIKTIGDAYMAAGGIPEKNSTNPVEVVLAALEMQTYMNQLKTSKTDIWDLRIGIHTGPVIAGVVGHKKVSYDIWGDTVNTASRMESSGEPGKVNISGITYGMVKDYFLCEYRGKLPVKYKGNIDMYFVNGLRPELSVDLKGLPNKRFFTKLQLLRLGDLEEKVFESIMSELSEHLHFHNLNYSRKVYAQSFLLCRAEEIEQEERLLVRTAALLLYTGLTQAYNNFENRSSVIAREILPDFGYSELQIDQICNLILATKQPFDPHNSLEKILIDAKMEYIGRPDFTEQIKLMFQELKEGGAKINGQQFKKQQLELLYSFEYYTLAAQRLREVPGTDQMTTLEQERWI